MIIIIIINSLGEKGINKFYSFGDKLHQGSNQKLIIIIIIIIIIINSLGEKGIIKFYSFGDQLPRKVISN